MGIVNVYDKVVFENQEKRRKFGNKRYFYINFH